MTARIVFGLLIVSQALFAQKSIIFDTDIAPDYDDVGALTLLHAFADRGEAKILATISCNVFPTTGPALSVLNTYFNRPDIPIGITRGSQPNKDCKQEWAQFIIGKYPHALKSNDQAEDAVKLYRRILAGQPDHSVTIVSVGFFTNLSDLLNSPPDKISSLSGYELVSKKVHQLVSMAAGEGNDGKGFREFNVWVDAPAAKNVFDKWPTPILLSEFQIGVKVLTGIRLTANKAIQNSPVKDAFDVALKKDNNTLGRNSWDQTAVLVAVRGIEPLFNSKKRGFDIQQDGTSIPDDSQRFTSLTFSASPEEIAKVIEDLMMHQPVKKK